MANDEIAAALDYHEATKHSLASVRADRHTLDWQNQPRPFKLYAELEAIPLPNDYPAPGVRTLSAIFGTLSPVGDTVKRTRPRTPDMVTLAAVLHYAAGITKQLRHP